MRLFRYLLLLFLLPGPATAATDLDLLLDTAERHVRLQTQGLPGKVSITLGTLDSKRLPPCSALEAFTPSGARLLGKTHVGVRCLTPNTWSVLLPVQISAFGHYVTSARPLLAGQPIQASDLNVLSGDLSTLPTGVVTDPAAALGKTPRNSLAAGLPLRADQLIAPIVIHQGQTVRVISKGEGFSVASEGRALSSAAEGQIAQIRMASGQTVSGVARANGSVEIAF